MSSDFHRLTTLAGELRSHIETLATVPSPDLIQAHEHLEEIILCVSRHDEAVAIRRTTEAAAAAGERLAKLKRASMRAETSSPRPIAPYGTSEAIIAEANRVPRSVTVVPLSIAGGAHA